MNDNMKKHKRKTKIKNVLVLERTRIETQRDQEMAGFELCRLKKIHDISERLRKNKPRYIG